jgi:hypothetical protein
VPPAREPKEHSPPTVNVQYYESTLKHHQGDFSFPVLKNFIASTFDEIAHAGFEDRPEKRRYFVYLSAIELMWSVISFEANRMEGGKSSLPDGVQPSRIKEIYEKLKPEIEQCGDLKVRAKKLTSGDSFWYTISLLVGTQDPIVFETRFENLDSVTRMAEEEGYRRLNCDSARKFALCILLLQSLGLFTFDYSLQISERKPRAEDFRR